MDDEQVAHCPILVLGNKIDKPGAASEEQLKACLNIYGLTTGKVRKAVFQNQI